MEHLMRDVDIPAKTAAGQQEIGLKQRKLTSRARSLLIMIHGAETVAELSRSMHSPGAMRAILNELAAKRATRRRSKHSNSQRFSGHIQRRLCAMLAVAFLPQVRHGKRNHTGGRRRAGYPLDRQGNP
jgi:hypothetical protein